MDKLRELEEKYIEERIAILQKLTDKYGEEVLNIAAEVKSKLEYSRAKDLFQKDIPVNMEKYYNYAFNEFENLKDSVEHEIVELTKNKLILKVHKCKYCDIYSKFSGNQIAKRTVCDMDLPITKALNESFTLERPSRKMDGDKFCTFIITKKEV